MRKKLTTLLALLSIPMLCCSCQLLPVEEELPAAPVIRAYEAKEYKLTTVMRGDIQLTENVSCTFKPANKESLYFALAGEVVEGLYAQKGQEVRKGELLAELESGNLQEQIGTQEYELTALQSKEEHLRQEIAKETALNQKLREDSDDREASDERLVDLALRLEEAKDAVLIKEKQLAESRADLRERQIHSGLNGTVTFVRDIEEGDRSEKNKIIYTVADMNTSVFIVEGEKAAYFPVGTEVTIVCKEKEYHAVSVEPASLNLLEEDEDEEKLYAYLQPDQPDPTLESGSNAKVHLVHDQREDVLYVNKRAVKSANGEHFVYVLDKNGLREMLYVSTGLDTGEYMEITGGLSEGDSVVLE